MTRPPLFPNHMDRARWVEVVVPGLGCGVGVFRGVARCAGWAIAEEADVTRPPLMHASAVEAIEPDIGGWLARSMAA